MNAFSLPSKQGIYFAKIRGNKVTDYIREEMDEKKGKVCTEVGKHAHFSGGSGGNGRKEGGEVCTEVGKHAHFSGGSGGNGRKEGGSVHGGREACTLLRWFGRKWTKRRGEVCTEAGKHAHFSRGLRESPSTIVCSKFVSINLRIISGCHLPYNLCQNVS